MQSLEESPGVHPQDEFIRDSFARVCRLYWGVTLVRKISWHADAICRVRVIGLRTELQRDFEQRVIRAFDATGFSVLGCTFQEQARPPCHVFEIRSRLHTPLY